MFNFINKIKAESRLRKEVQEELEKEKVKELQQNKLKQEEERKKRQEEEKQREQKYRESIEEEIDKYLNTAFPSFILHPMMEKNIYNILKARATGGDFEIAARSEEEYKVVTNYYNDELNIFLKLLQKKGISIEGSERNFLNLFVKKVKEKNYNKCLYRYGNEKVKLDIKEALYRYIDVFDNDIFDTGNCDFMTLYLYRNHITPNILNHEQFASKLEQMLELYKIDYKVGKMEQRLSNESTSLIKIDINMIDSFSGIEFESFLKDLFINLGYIAETTKTTGDQGIDLIIKKNNETTVVQAKCYASSVGNSAIQEVIAGKQFYNAGKCMVVTNNYFTNSAKELADKTNTILWDRNKLIEMIKLIY